VNQNSLTTTVGARRSWVIGLVILLALLHVLMPSRVWVAALICIGGAYGLGYLWARELAKKVTISRQQYYGWAHVGDLLEERFVLENGSWLPILFFEIDDQSSLPGYSARSVRSADPHQTVRWRTEGICRQRGLFSLGPWSVRSSDPFGFFSVTLRFPEARSILVYPPVVHLPTLLLPRGTATGSGRTSGRANEVTPNASGVRPYVPGDSLNRVHWASTARRSDLVVKTFDLEPSGDLWIILDLDAAVQVGEGEESTEEYAVILASSLADRMLRQNRAVGLAAYGTNPLLVDGDQTPVPTVVVPQKGKAQQWRILQALATVRAGGNWPLARVLQEMDRNLGQGMTLAIITASCDPNWIAGLMSPMRRGVAPTAWLLDPVSFGGQGNVNAMAGMLADFGVASHRIVRGQPFKPVAEHKRTGRPEYRVLGATGRVVPLEA
jgi:uncharacterized protein (DUF58 family)